MQIIQVITFLATPAQAKFLLCSLEQVAIGIGLYVNSDKTEFMCFNQDGAIFWLNGKPLKLTCLGENISSAIIYNSAFSDEIKREIYPEAFFLYGHTTCSEKKPAEKLVLHKNTTCRFEHTLEKTAVSNLTYLPNKTTTICWHCWWSKEVTFPSGLLHMDILVWVINKNMYPSVEIRCSVGGITKSPDR